MICCENFNSFTIYGILNKMNVYIIENDIDKQDIINIIVNSNGSLSLFYWSKLDPGKKD